MLDVLQAYASFSL